MMLFAAGKDRIVSTRAVEEFAVGLKVGNLVLIPGCRHEVSQVCRFLDRAAQVKL